MLHQKRVIEEAVWSNPQIEQFLTDDDDPGLAVTLFDLVKTFQGVLERAKTAAGLRNRHGRCFGAGHDPLPAQVFE